MQDPLPIVSAAVPPSIDIINHEKMPPENQPQYPAGSRHAKKSRRGCFNCKARKVKCSETSPACESCQAREVPCRYPTKAEQRVVRRRNPAINSANSLEVSPTPLNPTPITFKAVSFQYFHHFLTAAYPHLPHDSDRAWRYDIPRLSHYYEPLLHAALSLGAFHFASLSSRAEYTTDALVHRGLALTGLRELIAKDSYTDVDLDVLLAICYSLTVQSGFINDGLPDLVSLVRGCALITERILSRGASSVFCLDPTSRLQFMLNQLPEVSTLETFSVTWAIRSLEALTSLLQESAHQRFHRAILKTLSNLHLPGSEAYSIYLEIYPVWYTMDETAFQAFIAKDNSLTQVLLAYFAAILVIMQPYLAYETPDRFSIQSLSGALYGWVASIQQRLPVELCGFLEWPSHVVKTYHLNQNSSGSDRLSMESNSLPLE